MDVPKTTDTRCRDGSGQTTQLPPSLRLFCQRIGRLWDSM